MELKTQQAKRENFEKILTFLASQRVRTSTVTPRDLANGNLKSLMRLILSLASHYKPHSVKQGRDSGKKIIIHTFIPLPTSSNVVLPLQLQSPLSSLAILSFLSWLIACMFLSLSIKIASFRANSQTTPNLNVATNRRFTQSNAEMEENDFKTVNALATLRRQSSNYVSNQQKRPILG